MNIKRSILFILLAIRCFGFPVHAQAPWNNIYDFCDNDTNKYRNITYGQYAEDSFFIATGFIYPLGLQPYRSYIGIIDYKGVIQHKKVLRFSDQQNVPADNYALLKISENKYLLAGLELDTKTKDKLTIYQPFFYFFNKEGDSLGIARQLDTIASHQPMSVMLDAQKNIIVSGNATSSKITLKNGVYYYDTSYCWLAKYDSNANLIWSKKYYGSDKLSKLDKVILGIDKKSIFISGTAYDSSKKYYESFIAKTDTAGNILWRKFLPKPFVTYSNIDIIALSEGDYAFISCYSDSAYNFPAGPADPYIYYGKFNDHGDTLWTRHFRRARGDNRGIYITEAANNDLLLLCDANWEGRQRVTIMRTTGYGDIRWYREYYHIDTLYMDHGGANVSFLKNKQILLSGVFVCKAVIPGVFDTVGGFSWFVLTDTFGCQTPGCQQEDTMWHTGVQDINTIATDISVYPNPAQQILNIKTGASANSSGWLRANLCDINGRKLQTKVLRYNNAETLDLSYLPPGIYLLEIWEDGRRIKRMKVEHY